MLSDARGCVIDSGDGARTCDSDEELVALTRGRGPETGIAISALLRRHENAIHRACLSRLRDVDKAQDARQAVLIRVYRGVDRFRGRSNFRTWLYRIIHNECCTVAARHARHRIRVSLEDSAHLLDAEVCSDFGFSIELTQTVHAAIRRLSSGDRRVIMLRFFSDLPLRTIADRLGTSLGGAKMRLYRAIARFEQIYRNLDGVNEAPVAA